MVGRGLGDRRYFPSANQGGALVWKARTLRRASLLASNNASSRYSMRLQR